MASRLIPLLAAAAAIAACGSGAHADLAGRTARIWAVGDSAGGAHAPEVARLVRLGNPDRVLYLGDIYGGDAGFRDYKRLYGKLPMARTPGNHDWPDYWSGSQWYSFTAAGWRIIELNSETDRRAEQLRWLHALLRARGTCRIAFWHRPRYSGGPHGDAADMQPYWRALQGHAKLVISGHDHDMQRFHPRGGLVQLVEGAGGESHYPVDRGEPGLAWSEDRRWGALRIDLSRGLARFSFVATNGRLLDSQSVNCG